MKNKHILKGVMTITVLSLIILSNITIINAKKVENNILFNDPVINLQFYQMDFNYDDIVYENTDWGRVELHFVGQEPIIYFNLAVNGEWQIQNIPVLSVQGVDVDQVMAYYFDLGNEVGEILTDVTYGYALTEDTLLSMPPETHTAIVSDDIQIMSPGFGGEMPSLAPAGPLIGALVVTEQKYYHENFPNQDCGKNECCPAAVSNSLKFLNNRHKLGLDEDDLSIDEMKDATDWDDGCDLFKWWEEKKEYMEDDDDYPFTTKKVTDMDLLINEIEYGQDVEITESWIKNGKKTGHTSCLVGISKLENGEYKLDIAHDRQQGVDGGAEITSLTYNPNTNKLRCEGRGTSTFEYAIVECPRFSWLQYHWIEPGTTGCYLEAYGTHDCTRLETKLLNIWAKKCNWYRVYIPMELDDEDVNDVIFDELWWFEGHMHSDSTKFATAEYDDENAHWRLETVSTWVDENVEEELITYVIGDKNNEIPEIHVMVEMDKFLENPVQPQEEYLVINGICEDLPGYLIGTTPIVFNPYAGPEENPFSTTPLEYYVLSNVGEIAMGPPANQAPYSPKISGPPSGKPGTIYEYTIITTDPEDNNVYYNINWGDGNTDFIGPYVSGEEVIATHKWSKKGTYIIKAQAKDVYGEESEWSDPYPVTMPRSNFFQYSLLLKVIKYSQIFSQDLILNYNLC